MVAKSVVCVFALSLAGTVSGGTVTFHKDVEPVLQKHCQTCHRPGEVGPMPLLTYAEARPWAKSIKQATATGRMPPWGAAQGAPHAFGNDPRLSQDELAVLRAWADGGAPEGNPKDAPKPKQWVEGWDMGEPDRVFQPSSPYKVPAKGTVEYTYYIIPNAFKADTWVKGVEIRPEARRVVHHVIAYVRSPKSSWLKDYPAHTYFVPDHRSREEKPREEKAHEWREFLVGYAPGYRSSVWQSGRAKFVAAGSDLVYEIHFTTNGTEFEDKTLVGMQFAKEPPAERVMTNAVMNPRITIPPGADDHKEEAAIEMLQPAKLVALNPHMHLRGKAFEYRLTYPDGRQETILSVPKYDFNWQLNYEFSKPLELPKGTKIECTAWWDNSPNNPYNPDPKVEVKWGDQSWDEMMAGFFEMAFDRNVDPSTLYRYVRRNTPQQSASAVR